MQLNECVYNDDCNEEELWHCEMEASKQALKSAQRREKQDVTSEGEKSWQVFNGLKMNLKNIEI